MSKLQERQAEFLRVLAETGSPVQARRAVGVGSRAVRKWCEDEVFLEAYNDAIEVAQDAIRAKVRQMALAGSESMLALSMKVIEPVLRPQSAVNVGVGVKVGSTVEGRRAARIAAMSDEELVAEVNRIFGDARMRIDAHQKPKGPIVDVEAISVSVEPSELASGPDSRPSVDNLHLDGGETIDPESLL